MNRYWLLSRQENGLTVETETVDQFWGGHVAVEARINETL